MAYFGQAEANRANLQFEWAAALFDLERDTRIICSADGMLAAFAQHSSPAPDQRFEAWGPVHPGFEGRGLGSAILAWTERRSRSRIAPGSSTNLWNSAAAGNAGAHRLFEANGYEPIRTFWQMAMDLDRSFDAGPAPDGVTIRPVTDSGDWPAAFSVLNVAFATHFGHVEEVFDEWWAQQNSDETWDPALGLVAELDGRIVGASNNGVIDGIGWVYELGVEPEHQGRGIGRALLRRSLTMLADRGVRAGRLGVDTENATGAVELYRSIGMEPVTERRLFEKRIESD
jgi:mycothiol synthase